MLGRNEEAAVSEYLLTNLACLNTFIYRVIFLPYHLTYVLIILQIMDECVAIIIAVFN